MRHGLKLVMILFLFAPQVGAALVATRAPSKPLLIERIEAWTHSIQSWEPGKNEALERDVWLSFLYQLKFHVSHSYQDSDASLIQILQQMNEVESLPENRVTSRLTGFLTPLLVSLRDDREPTEDLFLFIKEFTEYGGILDAPTPEEFMETREYRGFGLSEAASPMDLEAAAESLEIQELAKSASPQLASEAAVLDSTEGRSGMGPDKIVPSNEPTIEAITDPSANLKIL
jgi:hypothetical protein